MSQNNSADKIVQFREPKSPATRGGIARPQGLSRAVRTLSVIQRLISSLDTHTLLKEFATAVSADVPIDGLQYEYPELDLDILHGRQAHHACVYRLTLEDSSLGTLVFRRRHRFKEAELSQLEELLCVLIYPLRNVLEHQRALRMAHLDHLTNLPNRQALERHIRREFGLAERYKTPLSFMVIDIDNFKVINDRYGHLAGDEILRDIAKTLTGNVRNTELVFRYGGDEFVILLSNTDLEGARLVAERLRVALDKLDFPQREAGGVIPTASIGVAQMKLGEDPESLFKRTDEAMYDAKARGRNRVVCASPNGAMTGTEA